MEKHFCTCTAYKCPRHPQNSGYGCDPCIKDNLERGKIPGCFFRAVNTDVSSLKSFTTDDFVRFYMENNKNSKK